MPEIYFHVSIPDSGMVKTMKQDTFTALTNIYTLVMREVNSRKRYVLWNPTAKMWMNDLQQCLNFYKVTADMKIELLPVMKKLKLLLPNYTVIETELDISLNSLELVESICGKFGIDYHEELGIRRVINMEKSSKYKFQAPTGDSIKMQPNFETASRTFLVYLPDDFKGIFPLSDSIIEWTQYSGSWCPANMSMKEFEMGDDEIVGIHYKYDILFFSLLKPMPARMNLLFNDFYLNYHNVRLKASDEQVFELGAILCQYFLFHCGIHEDATDAIKLLEGAKDADEALSILEKRNNDLEFDNEKDSHEISDSLKITVGSGLFKSSDVCELKISENVLYYTKKDRKSLPLENVNITCSMDLDNDKYSIKLTSPDLDSELRIDFKSSNLFATWLSAIELATKEGQSLNCNFKKHVDSLNKWINLFKSFHDKKSPYHNYFQYLLPKYIHKKLKIDELEEKLIVLGMKYRTLSSLEVKRVFVEKLTEFTRIKRIHFPAEIVEDDACTKVDTQKATIKEYLMITRDEVEICTPSVSDSLVQHPLKNLVHTQIARKIKRLTFKFGTGEVIHLKMEVQDMEAALEFLHIHSWLNARSATKPFPHVKFARWLKSL